MGVVAVSLVPSLFIKRLGTRLASCTSQFFRESVSWSCPLDFGGIGGDRGGFRGQL